MRNRNTILICLVFVISFLGCAQKEKKTVYDENLSVLAVVNGDTITAENFINDYEFGFPNLKIAENPKRAYLQAMIYEKLMAQEGYKKALDKSDYVNNNVEAMKKDLLVNYFIQEEIDPKIKITKKEIDDEIVKSSVTFKFRYWVEDKLEDAQKVREQMLSEGFEPVLNKLVQALPENNINPKIFESDFVTYDQLQPELFAAIKDLPTGEVSKPIKIDGKYWLAEVEKIRRKGILESEFNTKAPSIEQMLYYKKRVQLITAYVDSLLTPKNIVTRGKMLGILGAAYWDWMKDEKLSATPFCDLIGKETSHESFCELAENSSQPLVVYADGEITLGEMCEAFPFERLQKSYKHSEDLLKDIADHIGTVVRDRFLIQEAEKQNIQDNEELQSELKRWENKWVFEEYRYGLVKNIIKDHPDRLNQKAYEKVVQAAKKLEAKGAVQVNETMLDTIKVVQSQKSRWLTLQAFKTGSNTMVWPVVDANWKIDILKN